jgi:hypothetical protein
MGTMRALSVALGLLLMACLLGPVQAGGIKLLRPRDGATFGLGNSPPRVVLRWSGAEAAQRYVLQIATGKEVATFEISNRTTFTFRPKEYGIYRWWVATVGPDGRTTQPGEVRTFEVILGAPAPTEPAEGQVISFDPQKPEVQLSWSKCPVARYRLELAQDKAFSKRITRSAETRTSASASIKSPGTVYWRVRGEKPDTAWSKVRSFKVALSAPELISPDDDTTVEFTGEAITMELSWKPVPAADSYFIDVIKKGSRKKRPPYQTRDTKVVAKELTAGTYTWKVRTALDSGPESEPSEERTFDLVASEPLSPGPPGPPAYPSPPKLLTPEDQTRIVTPKDQPIMLFWQLVDGAAKYEVELSRQGGFSKVEVRRSVTGPMVSIPDLDQGTWYWRVRAVDSDGAPGEWADPFMFTRRIRKSWGNWD